MIEEEIRFIDLFSGIGGFRLGLERVSRGQTKDFRGRGHSTNSSGVSYELEGRHNSNYRCVWSCDNDKYANQVYTQNFGEKGHYSGDITTVDANSIPDHDLLCAGFPCQSFSVAGKRKGFKDTRGTLFFEILRIARVKRPGLLLLENVKGLLSHDEGLTYQIIIQSLEKLGYWVEWQVLNSKHYGVPQNRERVFIIGHLRGTSGREIFPITETGKMADGKNRRELIETGDMRTEHQVGRVYDSRGLGRTLSGTEGGWGKNTGLYAVLTPNRAKKRQRGRRFKNDGEPSFTLTGQDIRGVAIYRHPLNYGKKSVYTEDEEYSTLRTVQRNPQPKAFHENISRNVSIRDETVALRSGASHSYQDIIEYVRMPLLIPDTIDNKDSNADAKKENPDKILSSLWQALNEETREGRRLGESPSLLTEKILQQRMYEAILQGSMEKKSFGTRGQLPSETINPSIPLRELWLHLKPRYSPQRQEQVEQYLRELTDIMQKLPSEGALARKREPNQNAQTQRAKQQRSLRIRRLTPCECERLQGFPDGWTKGISDTQRYKTLGNAVSVPVITFLGRRIMERCLLFD